MKEILYTDNLVEITSDGILFQNYYFPVGAKKIPFSDLQHVEMVKPTLMNGKWRIHGTGDFRTWFPRDIRRPARDAIFIITRQKRWWRIGFTVENSDKVKRIFAENGFLISDVRQEKGY